MRSKRFLLALLSMLALAPTLPAADPPNVVLIMTDDQGYGDFGATGNKIIETPRIDELAKASASMKNFYVHPVCSPTRACLMTGRYNYRTRCIDTWVGRSMMDPDEVTLAEALSRAGYATGIFGKWHLGDCYPMRAIDQGFDEALVLRGGGLAQPSEPRANRNRYTNPILFHNGEQVQTTGYCTDVYFNAALRFIEREHKAGRKFFVYLPTNAPHGPYHDVPEDLRQHYLKKDLASLIQGDRNPRQKAAEIDRLTRIAPMITNIDQNVGRLLSKLEALGLSENTLVIFLVDNGPNTVRYVGPFRGSKTGVHEGGVRSPLWMKWPARLKPGSEREEIAAHIDLMPTILAACGVPAPSGVRLDGLNLLPLLLNQDIQWPERTLTLQSHRGDVPVRYHHFMTRDSRWKLVHPSGFGRESFSGPPQFELYDLINDPGETTNLAREKPDILARLKQSYDRWFDDVSSTRPNNYAPPRIHVGSPHETTTVLTRQDWRGGTWEPDSIGHWELFVTEAGPYTVRLEFDPAQEPETLELTAGNSTTKASVAAGSASIRLEHVSLPKGDLQFQAVLQHENSERGVYQAMIQME